MERNGSNTGARAKSLRHTGVTPVLLAPAASDGRTRSWLCERDDAAASQCVFGTWRASSEGPM